MFRLYIDTKMKLELLQRVDPVENFTFIISEKDKYTHKSQESIDITIPSPWQTTSCSFPPQDIPSLDSPYHKVLDNPDVLFCVFGCVFRGYIMAVMW